MFAVLAPNPSEANEVTSAINSRLDKDIVFTKMDVSEEERDISTHDELRCVNEVVKAILVLDHSKRPFKLSDIGVFLSQKPRGKGWNVVLAKAKEKLQEMGLSLVELKNVNPKTFILTSCLYPMPSMYRFAAESEVADRTLLVLILTFIFMKERPVKSDELFNHLKQLNIYSESRAVHQYFGDIKKKVLVDFMSQLYLEKVEVNKESDTFEIAWGERANAEVSKMSILKFVCEVGYEGSIEPKNMLSHYKKAMEEEGEGEKIDEGGDEPQVEVEEEKEEE